MTLLLYELLVAFFWAAVVTVVVFYFFGQGRHGGGGLTGILFFFLIVWLATWGIGAWLQPIGPLVEQVPWLLFLILAAVFGVLLGATAPRHRAPQSRAKELVQAAETKVEQEVAYSIFGLYFWILLILLVIILVVRYTIPSGWRAPTPAPGTPPQIQRSYAPANQVFGPNRGQILCAMRCNVDPVAAVSSPLSL